MTVVIIISSMILPSSTLIVSISVPFAITVPIPIPLSILVAMVTTAIAVSFSFSLAIPSVLAVSLFILLVLRGLFAFTAGGGSTILRSFLLAKALLLSFDEFGKGSATSLLVLKSLVLAQVFEEWYSLSNSQTSLR
jgi:hypothetical protein